MNTPFKQQRQTGWTPFQHGAFGRTVVTDGQLHIGPPHEQFPKADRSKIDALLSAAYLPNDRMDLEQNILVLSTGEQLILFDSGSGIDAGQAEVGYGLHSGGVCRPSLAGSRCCRRCRP